MTGTNEKEPPTRSYTSYVVLKRIDDPAGALDRTWQEVKTLQATTARDAIRQTVGETSGTYVAVPARSMVLVTVKVEKQTVVKLT